MKYAFSDESRRIVRDALLMYERRVLAAKRANTQVELDTAQHETMLEACNEGMQAIPPVAGSGPMGNKHELSTAVVLAIRHGLMLVGADLINERKRLKKRSVKTREIQQKIDKVIELQASFGEQRDLYEFLGEAKLEPGLELGTAPPPTPNPPDISPGGGRPRPRRRRPR